MITASQLEEALEEQKKSGEWLGATLIRSGAMIEDKFYEVLAERFGVPYVNLRTAKIDLTTLGEIPSQFVSHYKFIPLENINGSITIATSNPLDVHLLEAIRFVLKKEVKAVLASEKDVTDALKRYYGIGAETIDKITPMTGPERTTGVSKDFTQNVSDASEEASVIKFVNQLLLEAYKDRATDVHMEPYADEFRIRYRVDGVLYDAKVPPNIKKIQSAIISRIKIMANLDIAERRLPQDGRTKIRIDKEEVDLRISILPTPFGESVVIRMLSKSVCFGLENLGLLKSDRDVFERLIKAPHGIIFVTGPTGSGKTTTLYAALNRINSDDVKILTIEDPIEYQMKRIIQTQVHPKINFTFSQGLRSMLRHDPDIMMVGEVRDYETAEITIRVALTGHLVFSTIHTNDAAGGITRLIDMGVEPFLVASSVNAFIAQRLVRVICPDCKKPATVPSEILKELGVPKAGVTGTTIYEGAGCEQCKYTGYRGRTAIYEILTITEPLRELILKRSSSEQIKKAAVALGMRTLRQDGWTKIAMGITTPAEVLRVTQQEEALG